MARRPPWSVDHPDKKLGQDSYIRGRADRHALAYVYGPGAAAHLLTRDQARRIAANIAKLPELLGTIHNQLRDRTMPLLSTY